MALITLMEVWNMVLISGVLGFIFMDSIRKFGSVGFNWNDFIFAALITAPGIILHEFAHKFVAMFFGFDAVFKASYFGLILGIFLKVVGSPLILFAPGYVIFSGGSGLQNSLVAFSGPFMNLLIFLIALIILKYGDVKKKMYYILYLTKQINLFLFIFNMLPIPPLDGYKVFAGFIGAFF